MRWRFVVLAVCAFWCPSFGSFNIYNPLPGLSVCSFCQWEVKLDTVYNRIPSTITEIVCRTPNSSCGNNTNFQCRQIRSRVVFGFIDTEGNGSIQEKQNTTISIGCHCVRHASSTINEFVTAPIEKKSSY